MSEKFPSGESTSVEQEHRFTADEVIAKIHEVDPSAGELEITAQRLSPEGHLLSLDARAKGSATGYDFTLKGKHSPQRESEVTIIARVDFMGPDSDDVEFAEIIAKYEVGHWVKI